MSGPATDILRQTRHRGLYTQGFSFNTVENVNYYHACANRFIQLHESLIPQSPLNIQLSNTYWPLISWKLIRKKYVIKHDQKTLIALKVSNVRHVQCFSHNLNYVSTIQWPDKYLCVRWYILMCKFYGILISIGIRIGWLSNGLVTLWTMSCYLISW